MVGPLGHSFDQGGGRAMSMEWVGEGIGMWAEMLVGWLGIGKWFVWSMGHPMTSLSLVDGDSLHQFWRVPSISSSSLLSPNFSPAVIVSLFL